ncbi:MAG: hypothetical protein NTY79_02895, partial [Chloroflexi bacterium]|nr:hypothetical protein [Chloroflexota bacterium]
SSRLVLDELHFNSLTAIAATVSSTLDPGLPSVPMPVLLSNSQGAGHFIFDCVEHLCGQFTFSVKGGRVLIVPAQVNY